MQFQVARQITFSGGMNSIQSQDNLPLNESMSLINCQLSKTLDAIDQVIGNSKYAYVHNGFDEAITVHRIMDFTLSSGAFYLLVNYEIAGIQYVDSIANGVTTNIYISAVQSNSFTDFMVYQNRIYLVNGTNTLFMWDAIATDFVETSIGLGFTPTIAEMFNGRAYYSGNASAPSRVIWSQALTPAVFGMTVGYADINDSDGDEITEMKVFGANVIIFKKFSIWTVDGSPPKSILQIPGQGIGCSNKKATRKTQLGIVFLSKKGLYLFRGSTPIRISEKINTELLRELKIANNDISSSFLNGVYTIYFRETTSSVINLGYSFDLDSQQLGISKLSGFKYRDTIENSGNLYACKDGTSTILTVDTTNKIRKTVYEDATNPEVALSVQVSTRWENFSDLSRQKELRQVYIFTHSNYSDVTLTLKMEREGEEFDYTTTVKSEVRGGQWDSDKWDKMKWAPMPMHWFRIRLPSGMHCNRARLIFESTDADEEFTLNGIEYHYLVWNEI